MSGLARFFTRLRNVVTGRPDRDRLREELEGHLSAQTEDNIRAGMKPEEARRQAALKLGSVEAARQDYQAETGLPFLEDLLMDVRYALRVLRKSPAFTLVAVVTLTLGIGANVVVFGVLNAVLLRSLEVRDPENLYQLRPRPWTSFKLTTTSYPAFQDFRRRNSTFSDMAACWGYWQATLHWGRAVSNVHGHAVTGNYFDMLGVQPEVGRFFRPPDESDTSSAPYLVLSHSLWRRVFGADPGIVGATVRLDNNPFTIVAVAPAEFHGTEKSVWPDFWIPLVNRGDVLHRRDRPAVTVLGRLKPGVTPEQASDNLNAIAAHLAKEYPDTDSAQPLKLVRPGLFADIGDVVRGFLHGVTALALLVLVAACANLASLFAARAADRSRELALRMGLGASRWRLVRQLMTEALVVSMLGGAAGLLTASLLLRALNQWPSPYGRVAVSVDARVYLAALAFTLVSALLFGMMPARQVWQSRPLQAMKGAAREPAPLHRLALRDLLLGVQIAICMLLVTASLVAVRGMTRMRHPSVLGFEPRGAMLAGVELRLGGAGSDDVPLETGKALIQAVRDTPGVTAVGAANRLPLSGGGLRGVPVYRPGTTEFTLDNSVMAPYVFTVSPGYLEAAGTRRLSGRDVSWEDTTSTSPVAIVNQTFARRMWGDTPAIGQRFIVQRDDVIEVVGVVEDGKYHSIQEAPQPVLYLSWSQNGPDSVTLVVRSQRKVNEMAATLERTLKGLVPNADINVRPWHDSLGGMLFPARAATVSLGVMGLFAAMLAVTGIFGIAAYNVSHRMKELGIRVVLGARPKEVMAAAVGRPIVLLGVGSLVGLVSGVFASRLLGQIVYRANPLDSAVLGGAVLTMALLGSAASAIPALRALAVDPSRLMRED
jgi:predicted permease